MEWQEPVLTSVEHLLYARPYCVIAAHRHQDSNGDTQGKVIMLGVVATK
jgi:hypothetical protein